MRLVCPHCDTSLRVSERPEDDTAIKCPRCKKLFVAGGPKDAQGLKLPQGALEVEVTVEGEKEPLRLTVGNLDGSRGYFATTSRMKDEVFDVRKDLFEGPKGQPAYFKK